jgi:hypothetical protein
MKNLVSAARHWVQRPDNSIKNGIKVGMKLYLFVATLMFLAGFSATIYQGIA